MISLRTGISYKFYYQGRHILSLNSCQFSKFNCFSGLITQLPCDRMKVVLFQMRNNGNLLLGPTKNELVQEIWTDLLKSRTVFAMPVHD
jgi:hypothetical protein